MELEEYALGSYSNKVLNFILHFTFFSYFSFHIDLVACMRQITKEGFL